MAKRKFNTFRTVVLLLNLISVTALLLSYCSSIADPIKFWVIAMLGLCYPLFFLINSIFILAWALAKSRYLLISLIGILIGLKFLIANFGFRMPVLPPAHPSTDAIRMMAYNVRGFTASDPNKNAQIRGEILQLIKDKHPDILNLEEFSVNVATNKEIYKSLNKTFYTNYHYFKPYDYTQYDSTGIAIYSRYPIVNLAALAFPNNEPRIQAIYADLKCNNRIIRVYCVHLQSTRFDDHEHDYVNQLTRHGKIDFKNLSMITRKLKAAFIQRSAEVTLLKSSVDTCPYPYIIAGDFNDTPISYSVNQINGGLKNAFLEKGSGLGITYYGDFPNFQIDYIMATRQFDVIDYQAINKKLSDHYPLVSDLRLKIN